MPMMLLAVSLNEWKDQLDFLQEGVTRDCTAFLPELIVCGSIVLLLMLRLFSALNRLHLGWVSLVLAAFALVVTYGQWHGGCSTIDPRVGLHKVEGLELFTGLLAF